MRVTLYCYLPSLALIALAVMGRLTEAPPRDQAMLMFGGFMLLWPASFFVGVYWIVRLVRYAWHEGETPAPAPIDSGRIFGKLN